MMKKIVAAVCALCMLLMCGVGASAANLDAMTKTYRSCESESEFYIETNKSPEFLKTLFDKDDYRGLDVGYFLEQLLKSRFKANVACEMGSNAAECKMSMTINADMPVNLSEDLKFGANMTLNMWIEYNFENAENAKMIVIVKNPLNGDLYYYDALDSDALGDDADVIKQTLVEQMKLIDLDGSTKDVLERVAKLYEKYATATEENGYTTINFTNDSFVDMMYGFVCEMLDTEYVKNSLRLSGLELDEKDYKNTDVAMMVAFVKGLKIFADDAYTMSIKTDANGYLNESIQKLHFDFNICELAEAFGVSEGDLYPLTKENANVDVTFCSNTKYSKINENNVVTMPNIEDCIKMNERDYCTDEDYYVEEQEKTFWDFANGMIENGMYVDIADFLQWTWMDSDFLDGSVALSDNGNATVVFENDVFGEVTVAGSIYGDNYYVNGTLVQCAAPFKAVEVYDDFAEAMQTVLYVKADVLEYVLGAKVTNVSMEFELDEMNNLVNGKYYFDIERPNFGYTESADASIGIIGGSDGPTAVFVTE